MTRAHRALLDDRAFVTDGGIETDMIYRRGAAAQRRLSTQMPSVAILGGCCSTDARHIAALMRSVNGGTLR